ESLDNELEDSSYAPPLDIPVIHTKTQAIQALQSSCKLTERFWQVWYTQYLTALREKHQTKVGKKRAGALVPKVGSLVLICDEVQPRHMWRMGRISALPTNRDGVVREAVIKLPSHKHIRRPINLLVPLELEDTAENDCQDEQDTRHSETQEADGIAQEERQVVEPAHGYNLRSRSRQSQEHRNGSANVGLVSASILLLILALSSFCPSVATIAANSPQLKSTDFEASYRTYWVNKLTPEIQASYKIQSRRLDRPQGGEIIKRAHPAKHKTLPQVLSSEYEEHWKGRKSKSNPEVIFRVEKNIFASSNDCYTLASLAPAARMATRDVDGDAAYLSRLLIRSHPSAEQLENELEKCFNEIQRYIIVSRTIRNHFKFIQ
ncbi:hypothetical protein GCK32_018706, partial [Trichostrongylus colubriformis]